jgi:hypothetical protein
VVTAYVVVTLITILVTAGITIADLCRAGFVLANAAEVGLPQCWLPKLAVLKGAGAVGLLLGLAVPLIGIAAAGGLVLFFIGALVAHVRAGVFYNIYFPGTYFALAVASLVLALVVN